MIAQGNIEDVSTVYEKMLDDLEEYHIIKKKEVGEHDGIYDKGNLFQKDCI